MSVIQTKEVPEHAKLMTLRDVCDFQWDIIRSWKKRADVWGFSYGVGLLAGTASLSSLWIGEKLKTAFKISKKNSVLILLPLFTVPPCLIYAAQTMYIVQDLFLMDLYECIICPMSKSAMTQVGIGIVYPVVAGNLISWATLYKESAVLYNVPHYSEYMKTLKFLYVRTRPLFPRITIMFLAHTILSQSITYCQYKQLQKIKGYTLLEEEEEREMRLARRNRILEENEQLKTRRIVEMEEQERKNVTAKEKEEEFVLRKDIEEKERNYG